MTAERLLYLRMPDSAFTAEGRAQNRIACPEDMISRFQSSRGDMRENPHERRIPERPG